MSKTTEFLIPPTMHLTPKHVDAMHLIKLFIKEYEGAFITPYQVTTDKQKLAKRMSNVYDTCKNFGF